MFRMPLDIYSVSGERAIGEAAIIAFVFVAVLQRDFEDDRGDVFANIAHLGRMPDEGCDLAVDGVSGFDEACQPGQIIHGTTPLLSAPCLEPTGDGAEIVGAYLYQHAVIELRDLFLCRDSQFDQEG